MPPRALALFVVASMRSAFGRGPCVLPALLVVALATPVAGCSSERGRDRAANWVAGWRALSRSGPRWRAGVEFVVLTHEGRPGGVRHVRERWVLLRRDSVEGVFERQRDGGRATIVCMRLHPAGPEPLAIAGVARAGDRYPAGSRLEAVSVPAGRFRCGRTWRNDEERDGRVMRIDEWWAPGVPVPVQSWKREERVIDTPREPPRRAGQVLAGTAWAVLESVRRP